MRKMRDRYVEEKVLLAIVLTCFASLWAFRTLNNQHITSRCRLPTRCRRSALWWHCLVRNSGDSIMQVAPQIMVMNDE